MEIMNPEIPKYIDSITKRVYPLTENEKNCINELGKMHINRGHLKKAIIETISKFDVSLDKQTKTNETAN